MIGKPRRGILFYDAACGVCRGMARRFGHRLAARGYRLIPLQSPDAPALTGRTIEQLMDEAHLLAADGRVLRGIDTVIHIAGSCPFTRPLTWLARVPGVTPVLRRGYRAFARNRYRISRACGLDRAAEATLSWQRDAVPLIWIALALSAGGFMYPWIWMWTIAFSMFAACKWWMWGRVSDRVPIGKTLAWFFTTPSMDARGFFSPVRSVKRQAAAGEWLYAIRNIIAGAAMVWIIPHSPVIAIPILAIWTGMIGTILMLHFGAFHLLALATGTQPLMNRPTRALTLAEFWGRRWNRGFSTPARELIFAPLIRRGYSATAATAAVFAVSGLVHDLVISIPARGGYGLPTFYFLLQLAGVLVERTAVARRIVRCDPFLGHIFAMGVALLPAPLLLFHGPFVRNVFAPFLFAVYTPLVYAIGGLS